MRCLIVSRHSAAVSFIREQAKRGTIPYEFASCPVWEGNITTEHADGIVLAGNVPLSIAAVAECVWAIEFGGTPPRGVEYTAEDMVAAGAYLTCYKVSRIGGA